MKRGGSEEQIQRSIADFLDRALPGDAIWWHCPNGGHRHPVVAGKLKASGVKAGVFDIIIIWRGRPILFEVKDRDGDLSGPQETFQARALLAGATIGPICRSVDDVHDYLERDLGMPLKVKRFGLGWQKVPA